MDHFAKFVSKELATPFPTSGVVEGCRSKEVLRWSDEEYRSGVGSLIFLMTGTRSHLEYAVGYLARSVIASSLEHGQLLSRVLGYVLRTENLGLEYLKGDGSELKGYADAE